MSECDDDDDGYDGDDDDDEDDDNEIQRERVSEKVMNDEVMWRCDVSLAQWG